MTEDAIKAALKAEDTLGLTAYAEAAGDWHEGGSSAEERIAVGCVVRNRVRAKGIQMGSIGGAWEAMIKTVCLARYQFSCWDAGPDPNHVRLMGLAGRLATGLPSGDLVLDETIYLARGVLSGVILDRTNGATHYYAPAAMKPAGSKPFWVYLNGKDGAEHNPVARIGSQVFYRGV